MTEVKNPFEGKDGYKEAKSGNFVSWDEVGQSVEGVLIDVYQGDNYNKDGKVIGDVWQIKILGQNDKTERVGYATQKPKELVKQIIASSSNEGDTVADFYLGSGTTAVVCKELNRNFIGCDTSESAVEISRKRTS